MSACRNLRRRSIRAFYQNAAWWGLGNGLANSSLIVYLASAFGAVGLTVGVIVALPRLVGIVRLATPLWIESCGDLQRYCVRLYLTASAAMVMLAVLAAPGLTTRPRPSLIALIALWTVCQLLEYFGNVGLWAWIGQSVPRRWRGRFIGRRGALLSAMEAVGLLAGAAGVRWWSERCHRLGNFDQTWLAYAGCALVGAACYCIAALRLKRAAPPMETALSPDQAMQPHLAWRHLLLPFSDPSFRGFLAYGVWFSLARGITGTAMYVFQLQVLGFTYPALLALDGGSQCIKALLMPRVGRIADRRGSVPVLVVSQLIVAAGLGCYLFASPDHWHWIIGAYACWIAYAGIEVALPKLMLSLSRSDQYPTYTAAWFAWTDVVYALSTLAGGMIYDLATSHFEPLVWRGWLIDRFVPIFIVGIGLRISAAAWAAHIRERSGR